ncbi:Alpha/Beta hydrolase protein [Lipomyces arxii]|uniref:Alpha/Beta hydrolase protein n=1 Tax=Lipomyces arxii TaxID=56418 RepID=UPI0034CED78E
MIDHLLGRPSQKFKKIHVLVVSGLWIAYILQGPKHGPPIIRRLSRFLTKNATAWQIHVLTMTGLYMLKNVDKLVNLESPEPLANIYSKSFYRASWILTALDAGFWTAMPVKPKAVRDIASILFSIYYLIFADQADSKVRKVRATVTAEHLRVSWEKQTSPFLRRLKMFTCPRIQVLRAFEIPRPPGSPYRSRIKAYLYYDGPRHSFKLQSKILLNFPGGGFVSMTPRHHDDSLCAWAKKLKMPVISINYGKAPEHPYPYSLDECYDAYMEIMRTKGRCIGLSGTVEPQIVLLGDSAGGNFVAGTVLKLLTNTAHPRLPASLIMIYPALDLNFNSWMTDEQVRLLREESVKELNSPGLMQKKESMYKGMSGKLRVEDSDVKDFRLPSSVEATDAGYGSMTSASNKNAWDTNRSIRKQQEHIGTLLAMTSRVSYFSDKVITPEMLRAMIILYIGPVNRPDFTTDYLLSPVNAPAELLAKFPKVYMMCGEVDPLVDDTVIFAGRLREAKRSAVQRMEALAMSKPWDQHNESEFVEVMLIRGISHGFLQIPMLLPEGKAAISRCAAWIQEAFASREQRYRFNEPLASANNSINGSNILTTEVGDLASNSRRPITTRRPLSQLFKGLLSVAGLGWIVEANADIDDYDEDDDYYYYEYDDEDIGILDPDWTGDPEEDQIRNQLELNVSSLSANHRIGPTGPINLPLLPPANNTKDDFISNGNRHVMNSSEPDVTRSATESSSRSSNRSSDSRLHPTEMQKRREKRKLFRQKSWDKNSLVLEADLMERRRNTIVQSLTAVNPDGNPDGNPKHSLDVSTPSRVIKTKDSK